MGVRSPGAAWLIGVGFQDLRKFSQDVNQGCHHLPAWLAGHVHALLSERLRGTAADSSLSRGPSPQGCPSIFTTWRWPPQRMARESKSRSHMFFDLVSMSLSLLRHPGGHGGQLCPVWEVTPCGRDSSERRLLGAVCRLTSTLLLKT